MKKIFYLTFGQKYPWRDGWVEVEADDIEQAREIVVDTFDNKFAFLYSAENFKPEHFPQGKLGRTLK